VKIDTTKEPIHVSGQLKIKMQGMELTYAANTSLEEFIGILQKLEIDSKNRSE
jgi:hypothetical protein